MSKHSSASSSHEYCQGYVDKNGIWNNGFLCRRWGGQDVTYCCGDGQDRFCCPELPHLSTPTADGNSTLPGDGFSYIPIIIGICIVVMVVFVVVMTTTLCCLFCSCCPVKKRQRSRKQSSFVINGTLPFCTEAEATSSVIAAEALQVPFRDFTLCTSTRLTGATTTSFSGGQSPASSFDQRRRCEGASTRPWSPTTSLGTTEDLDSTITSSLYHKCELPDVSWQAEVQNLCNCDYKPILKLEPKRNEKTNILLGSTTGSPLSIKQYTGLSSAWRLDGFGGKKPPMTIENDETPPLTKQTLFELSNQRPGPYSSNEGVASSQGRWQTKLRLPMSFLAEAERHKRDSGVLVEEQDASDNSGSPVCVGHASDDQVTIARSTGPRSEYTWKSST